MLRDAGIDGLIMGINIHFGGFPLQRTQAFRWEGPDGQSILAFNGEHYNGVSREMRLNQPKPSLDEMSAGYEAYCERLVKRDYPYDFIYLSATHPHFDDNNPPDPDLPMWIERWNESGRGPRMRFTTPDDLIARISEQPAETIPTHSGDWTDFWNFGAASSALEISINRRAKAGLNAARSIDARLPSDNRRTWAMGEAFQAAAMGDEHTWGAFCSMNGTEPAPVMEQWMLKAENFYKSRSYSNLALRDGLDAWAGNPVQRSGNEGVLLFNPSGVPKRGLVPLLLEVSEGKWEHLNSCSQIIPTRQELLPAGDAVWIDAGDLEPFEVRLLDVDKLPLAAAEPEGCSVGDGVIESLAYKLTFDTVTGQITSLYDHTSGKEVIDQSSRWGFFEPVRETIAEPTERAIETGDPRQSFVDMSRWHDVESMWNPDWEAAYEIGSCTSCKAEMTPEGPVLTRVYAGPSTETVTQEILLDAYSGEVKFTAKFVKADVHEPESLYFPFALGISDPKYVFDTASQATEWFRDQLKGSCKDWFTSDTYAAAHGEDLCVVIACPDAPLWQAGGLSFGRCQTEPPEGNAMLAAWPMNNYWNTNFRLSQPGPVKFTWVLKTMSAFDAAKAARCGSAALTKVDWNPVVSREQAPGEGSLISVDNDQVQLLQMKRAASEGIIARLKNHSDSPATAQVTLPGQGISSAQLCSTLEEPKETISTNNGAAEVTLPPHAIVTILLT
jgi:hypothetical protein